MKSSTKQQFSTTSYAGVGIEQMHEPGTRPPSEAQLVVYLDCGSGPGGGDYRTYFISADKNRSVWELWQMISDYDTGESIYVIVAYGEPFQGYSAKQAAELLLTKSLIDDHDIEWVSEPPWTIMKSGLLEPVDIERIEHAILDGGDG